MSRAEAVVIAGVLLIAAIVYIASWLRGRGRIIGHRIGSFTIQELLGASAR